MRNTELYFTITVLFLGIVSALYMRFVIYRKIKDFAEVSDEPLAWHTNCLVFAVFIIMATLASDRDLPLWLSVVTTFSFVIHDISSIVARRILGMYNNRNLYNILYVLIGLVFTGVLLF